MALRDPMILDDTVRPDERRVLMGFASELKTHFGDQLERVSVFGSRARGDLGPDSDIDVLIILRISRESERRVHDVIWEMITRARALAPDPFVPISPVILSLERFEELKSRERRFALDAESEGIRL